MLKSFTGQEIKKMRKSKEISQQELADKLGVSQQLVSYWETGQREPNEDSQALLAEFILDERKKERKTTPLSFAEGRSGSSQPPQVIPDIPVLCALCSQQPEFKLSIDEHNAQTEKKLEQLLDVLAHYPNPTLHAQAANLFLQIGKPDEALNHILKTLKARPDSPPYLKIQARCFLMKGEDNLAVPILEQLLSTRPYDSNIIARLAQAYKGAGETEKAKELLVSAINLSLEQGYKNRFLASLLCDMNE